MSSNMRVRCTVRYTIDMTAIAIEFAQTEHIVCFLLTAYVETLGYYETTRLALPEQIRHLPLAGKADVDGRLRILRALLERRDATARDARGVTEEAIDIFAAACRRLNVIDALTTNRAQSAAMMPRCRMSTQHDPAS